MIDPKKLLAPQDRPKQNPQVAGAKQGTQNQAFNQTFANNDPAQQPAQQQAFNTFNPAVAPPPAQQPAQQQAFNAFNPAAAPPPAQQQAPAVAQQPVVAQPVQPQQYRQRGSGFINPEAFGIGRTFAVNQQRVINPISTERNEAVQATQGAIEAARGDWRDDVLSQNLDGLFVDGDDAFLESREFGDMRSLADTSGGQAQLLGSRTAGGGRLDAAAFQSDSEARARLAALEALTTADDINAANMGIRDDALGLTGEQLTGLEAQQTELGSLEQSLNSLLGTDFSNGYLAETGQVIGGQGYSPERIKQIRAEVTQQVKNRVGPSPIADFKASPRVQQALADPQRRHAVQKQLDYMETPWRERIEREVEAAMSNRLQGQPEYVAGSAELALDTGKLMSLSQEISRLTGAPLTDVQAALRGIGTSTSADEMQEKLRGVVDGFSSKKFDYINSERAKLDEQRQGFIDFQQLLKGTSFGGE